MKEEKVENYPDLIRINKTFFVNSDKNSYIRSLERKKQKNKITNLEERISSIESKLDGILKKLEKIL